jgi:transcriptional regulator with XRE-family HTH domain
MRPIDWRKQAGLSQESAAKLVGVSGKNPARTWQRWEIGEREPPVSVIAKIETLSDGNVSARDWLEVGREYRAKHGIAHSPFQSQVPESAVGKAA